MVHRARFCRPGRFRSLRNFQRMEAEGWSLYCYRIPSPGPARAQKTPEMNVSGRDKQNLKTWAPNFEKQKNESTLKISKNHIFFGIRNVRTGHDQNQWSVMYPIAPYLPRLGILRTVGYPPAPGLDIVSYEKGNLSTSKHYIGPMMKASITCPLQGPFSTELTCYFPTVSRLSGIVPAYIISATLKKHENNAYMVSKINLQSWVLKMSIQ